MPNLIINGPDSDMVALTFDMGSEGGSTLDVMDALKKGSVHATFFVTGAWSDANPQLLKSLVAAGHQISNHSYTHPDFTTIKPAAMVEELRRTEDAVKHIASVSTKPFWRPPFGAYDQTVLRTVTEEGYRAVYWTLDSTDWQGDSTTVSVVARVLKYVEPGSIVVFHGSLKKTAEALPRILPVLRERGLRQVPLSQLMSVAH